MRSLAFAPLLLVAGACTPQLMEALPGVLAAGFEGATPSVAPSSEMLVFGGPGHDTFLGCINCTEHADNSLTNPYSDFGSQYSQTSIFNPYSDFGSPYSQYSACNPYASNPPIIVDREGRFYGRLTLNAYAPDAIPKAVTWLRAEVCGNP